MIRMQGDTLGRFNDARLEQVGAALLAAMERHRALCVHRLAKDRNQAIQFGRFLDNRAVSTHEMLVHAARQSNRAASGRHVLAIQSLPPDLIRGTPRSCISPATLPASAASARRAMAPMLGCSCRAYPVVTHSHQG
jgi:hypothetical protein